MTTLRDAKGIAGSLGFTLTKRDNEYRLADAMLDTLTAREASAYYTNDIDDALDTARAIRQRNVTKQG